MNGILYFVIMVVFFTKIHASTESNYSVSFDIPMVDHENAPLTARFDMTSLNNNIKLLVAKEVERRVEETVRTKLEDIVRSKMVDAIELLYTNISNGIKEFRKSTSDTNTPGTGNLMTDDHYDALLKLIIVERTARLQLQQYVTSSQSQISEIPALKLRVEELENSSSTVKSQSLYISNFQTRLSDLERKYASLHESNTKLQSELEASLNETNELKQEVISLKQMKAVDQIQTLTSVEKEMNKLQGNVLELKNNNQARGQDFVALYKEVTENKKTISDLENYVVRNVTTVQTNLFQNISNIQRNLSTVIKHNLTRLESKIESAVHDIKEENEYVGFTAFGTGSGTKPRGTILKFPIIKSSYGLILLSAFKRSGKFTCENQGLYIISITVMSCSTADSVYSINRNNNEIGEYYIGMSRTSSTDCNSATGTIVQQLDANDTVYVKTERSNMDIYGQWSSFSVMKLK